MKVTQFENKILETLGDEWMSVSNVADILYPNRFAKRQQGLRRNAVKVGLRKLLDKGAVIRSPLGMYRKA